MTVEKFEREIGHLDQVEVLTGAISSLNKLLVDKKLVREDELQNYFLQWLKGQKKTRRTRKKRNSK